MATETLTSSSVLIPPDRRFHFPPFPPVPDGVQITPFADFKEYGTRVVGPDNIERDGLGIATVALPPKSKKRSKGKKKAAAGNPGPKQDWWEAWEASGEHLRIRGPYNPALDRVGRLLQAATDFHKYYEVHAGPQKLWDHFRNFAGISPSTIFKTSNPTLEDDEMLDDDADDDDDGYPVFETADVATQAEARARDPAPAVNPDTLPPIAKEESKAEIFLNDPVRGLKMFLSSYMRDQGLVWDERKLVGAPHLMRFFVKYLIRNAVLPEHTDALMRALDVIAVAGIELPRMPAMSNALPDAFARGCEGCWGRKVDGLVLDEDEEKEDSDGEREAKRPRLDPDLEVDAREKHGTAPDVDPIQDNPDEKTQAGAKIPTTDNITSDEKDAANKDSAHMDTDTGTPSGWATGGWGAGDWDSSVPTDTAAPPAAAPNADPLAPFLPPTPTLLALLGPTALPLTHAPGAVEWSLRRIASISGPKTDSTTAGASPAGAVERGLAARLHRVALVPWLDWHLDPEIAAPRLLRASAPGARHDPRADAIVLLVASETAERMCVGMGVCGTWVQLARATETGSQREEGTAEGTYWYLEEVGMIVPSFWVV
ncbi:hypothetical protein B0H17DRAFT_1197169 [Mycena rosella]|uniref:Uncharacterized protein n=1 Tax=Mycena rosella TaxID=1033263 RepID=A0AAD7DU47_MYCRO|nr:hypothetical protein B0H17DRAFT_1197169 [Mycena rosella]